MGREIQDQDDAWESEAMQAMSSPAETEFTALKRRLRRQAGYDLTWWEKIVYRVSQWLKIRKTFK